MTIHAGQPVAEPTPPPPPRTAWSSAGYLLIEVRGAVPPASGRGPAELLVGGARVLPPLLSFDVPGARLTLARATPGCAEGAPIEIRHGAETLQAELGPPCPPAALLHELPPEARPDGLRTLLGALHVFRARDDAGFAALLLALAAPLAEGQPAARPLAGGSHDSFSVWRLPAAATPGIWRILSPDSPLRSLPRIEAGQRLVLLDGLPPPGAVLLPPGGAPVPLAAAPAALPGLLPLARRGGEPRRVLLDLLARRALAGEARAAACLRDIGLLAPARVAALADPALPVGGALEAALPDGEGGAFLRGWLRDPLGLVEAVALRAPGGSAPVAALHRVPRPDLAERLRRAPHGDAGPAPGFLALVPEAGLAPGTAQLGLELRLASGQVLTLLAPPGLLPPALARDLVLSATTPDQATPALMEGCISPAAARFHAAAVAPGPAPERIALGPARPGRAAVTVVVPLWRNLSFLRFQLAAFARDAAFRGPRAAELVYVLDSPDDRAEAEGLLRGLALLHDLPVTLLVQDRNRGYAPACNTGAAAGSAPLVLFLNSDVVPQAPGWLGALRARLARDTRLAAVGPKLLYASGAIQHAGLFFAPTPDGEWGSNHYYKGWPRDHAPACRARRVPAVTGAAMLVRRALFEAAGGFATDYILGDFEDSDLCLRLRAAGGEIGYEPAAELVHLERQSIAAHPGHAGTLAALHNRRLHAARWGDAIAALMRRHPHPRG